MTTFTLSNPRRHREYTDKFGPKVSYQTEIDDEGATTTVEISKKPTSAPPAEGETVEGDLHDPAFEGGLKRLKAFKQQPGEVSAQGSGPVAVNAPQDIFVDARQAAILRQHSQTAANYFWANMQKEGVTLPGATAAEKLESYRKLVDAMDDDVKRAVAGL